MFGFLKWFAVFMHLWENPIAVRIAFFLENVVWKTFVEMPMKL